MANSIQTPEDFRTHFDVSRETIERLQIYNSLLSKWNPKINLVAKSTIDDVWHRHFADSAQLWPLADNPKGSWLDIGSGAGFPGLVIAAIAAEKSPSLKVSMIESDVRKSVFLQTVAREMGIESEIITKRIEDVSSRSANIISARALASVDKLLGFAEKHLAKDGICLFPKGANVDSELTEAASSWHIEYDKFPSITDSQAVILRIGEFHRV